MVKLPGVYVVPAPVGDAEPNGPDAAVVELSHSYINVPCPPVGKLVLVVAVVGLLAQVISLPAITPAVTSVLTVIFIASLVAVLHGAGKVASVAIRLYHVVTVKAGTVKPGPMSDIGVYTTPSNERSHVYTTAAVTPVAAVNCVIGFGAVL